MIKTILASVARFATGSALNGSVEPVVDLGCTWFLIFCFVAELLEGNFFGSIIGCAELNSVTGFSRSSLIASFSEIGFLGFIESRSVAAESGCAGCRRLFAVASLEKKYQL